jgi:hypothetical protein
VSDSGGIVESSPAACAESFRKALAKTFGAILPSHVFGCVGLAPRYSLGFVQGDSFTPLILRGPGGRKYAFSVLLQVRAVGSKKTYRLETEGYAYRLGSPNAEDPLFRWEYRREPLSEDSQAPRHHMHAIATASDGTLDHDMNRLHVPTGWVTIEEVLRFLLSDLKIKCPLSFSEWNKVLNDSERKFYASFTSRRFHPHPG